MHRFALMLWCDHDQSERDDVSFNHHVSLIFSILKIAVYWYTCLNEIQCWSSYSYVKIIIVQSKTFKHDWKCHQFSCLRHFDPNAYIMKYDELEISWIISSLYFASSEYIFAKLDKTRSWLSDAFKTWGFGGTERVQNEIEVSSNENDWCCSNDWIWSCWNWNFWNCWNPMSCWCCLSFCCRCCFDCLFDWFLCWCCFSFCCRRRFDRCPDCWCFDCCFDYCEEDSRFWCCDADEEFEMIESMLTRRYFFYFSISCCDVWNSSSSRSFSASIVSIIELLMIHVMKFFISSETNFFWMWHFLNSFFVHLIDFFFQRIDQCSMK